jgi:hypothetical protein
MAILTAAVVVVGLLCLADLLLTFGVIRRLREHTDQLAGFQSPHDAPVTDLADGATPAPFTAETLTGEQVTGPAGLRMVAFFSATCSACPERVPPFLEYVRANQLDPDSILAVMLNPTGEAVTYQEDVAQVARIVIESHDGEIGKAFKVRGYPTFFVLDGAGSLSEATHEPATLAPLTAARLSTSGLPAAVAWINIRPRRTMSS